MLVLDGSDRSTPPPPKPIFPFTKAKVVASPTKANPIAAAAKPTLQLVWNIAMAAAAASAASAKTARTQVPEPQELFLRCSVYPTQKKLLPPQ